MCSSDLLQKGNDAPSGESLWPVIDVNPAPSTSNYKQDEGAHPWAMGGGHKNPSERPQGATYVRIVQNNAPTPHATTPQRVEESHPSTQKSPIGSVESIEQKYGSVESINPIGSKRLTVRVVNDTAILSSLQVDSKPHSLPGGN